MSNAVIDSMHSHRSIRRFTAEPVNPETTRRIIEAGVRQATAGNLQLYSLILVEDPAAKAALGVEHAPLVIAALADLARVRRWFEVQGAAMDDVEIDAPHLLFIACWDAIIVLQSIVTAAESLGLGTCYYGGILNADAAALFDAPEHTFPAGLVAIGWPAEEPELSMRLPLDAVVHRDHYRQLTDEQISSMYAERNAVWDGLPEETRRKLESQGIANIAQGVARRKFSAQALADRTRGVLANLRHSRFRLSE